MKFPTGAEGWNWMIDSIERSMTAPPPISLGLDLSEAVRVLLKKARAAAAIGQDQSATANTFMAIGLLTGSGMADIREIAIQIGLEF